MCNIVSHEASASVTRDPNPASSLASNPILTLTFGGLGTYHRREANTKIVECPVEVCIRSRTNSHTEEKWRYVYDARRNILLLETIIFIVALAIYLVFMANKIKCP